MWYTSAVIAGTASKMEDAYKANILLVEDETLIAEDIEKMLQRWGYRVIGHAISGKQAIELAKEERPDLILMDIRIKGELNGVEAAISIESFYQRSIPIIFITAVPVRLYNLIRSIDPCLYLNKPFTEQELKNCIERKLHMANVSIR
jgi:CheY-like chemotaxis protein